MTEMEPFLTIVTPTYNRREKLRVLYQSLCRQTICADSFVWLIADDGSCDGTGEQVLGWQKEQDDRLDGFRIIYRFAENGGKHRALNLAVSEVETPLVFPVDSDDFLTEDAVESVHDAYVRELEDSEKDKGLESQAIALDGIAVIVNTQNERTDISTDMVKKIFTGEVTDWNDVTE